MFDDGGSRSATPERRIVLLGASNLTRGISTAIDTAARLWGRPLDVLAAFGHGRSYGMRSRVLVRDLPGIVGCGLWRALADRPRVPTAALVTDIGNDLLYEAPVDRIIAWIRFCLDELARIEARVVVTGLPIESIARLSDARFRLMRSILFPRSRLQLSTVAAQAIELDERLGRLCNERGIAQVAPSPTWFGFDPIHIKMRHWPHAWQTLLAPWCDAQPPPAPATGSMRRWLHLRRLAPERRWLFGIEQKRRQPAGRISDGSVISFF